MDYPIWDVAMGGGVLMALVAIPHVIVAHFAVGGGLVLATMETLALKRSDAAMRDLVRRSSLLLILISTVFGAVSGVGIWVVAGLISPGAISSLIHTYLWAWAMEWVFFLVEITAALVYYTTWDRIADGVHVMVGWVYAIAAYMSLVLINGIITFMLTPGRWLETGRFWDGFFNPTYLPSLLLRSGIAMLMAAVFLVFVALRSPTGDRPRLVRSLGLWLVAGSLISSAGYRWWEAALPEVVRDLFVGASPTIVALGSTRHVLLWSLTAALVVGLLALVAFPRLMRGTFGVALAVIIMASSFLFFAGYERVREGARKPFLIHQYRFSNGLLVDRIGSINETGLAAHSGWVDLAGDDPDELGRRLFQAQCASCHTIDGYLGITTYLPEDPDMIFGVLAVLWDMGFTYAEAEPGQPVDPASLEYPYMPPFVGSDTELETLATYLANLAPAPEGADGEGGA